MPELKGRANPRGHTGVSVRIAGTEAKGESEMAGLKGREKENGQTM